MKKQKGFYSPPALILLGLCMRGKKAQMDTRLIIGMITAGLWILTAVSVLNDWADFIIGLFALGAIVMTVVWRFTR